MHERLQPIKRGQSAAVLGDAWPGHPCCPHFGDALSTTATLLQWGCVGGKAVVWGCSAAPWAPRDAEMQSPRVGIRGPTRPLIKAGSLIRVAPRRSRPVGPHQSPHGARMGAARGQRNYPS